MSKKDIKKNNISANAISEDSLEDVSGGFKVHNSGSFLELNDEERKCLGDDKSWDIDISNGNYNISFEALQKAKVRNQISHLKQHGFEQEN